MPESVTDRCTRAHEFVFMLTKAARYYYDADAIREGFADERNGNPGAYNWKQGSGGVAGGGPHSLHKGDGKVTGWNEDGASAGRNKRSVWTVSTQPYSQAHFATFPPSLIEPMVLAGCMEGGTILDPFCGSGTVGEVCRTHNRKFVGMDLNICYLRDLALPRAEQTQSKLSLSQLPLFGEVS